MIELALCFVLVLVWYNSSQWQEEVNKYKGEE